MFRSGQKAVIQCGGEVGMNFDVKRAVDEELREESWKTTNVGALE